MSLPLPLDTGCLTPRRSPTSGWTSRMKREGEAPPDAKAGQSGRRPVSFLDFQKWVAEKEHDSIQSDVGQNVQHSGSLSQWSTGIVQESRWSPRCWLGYFACWAPAGHGCYLSTWTNKPNLA